MKNLKSSKVLWHYIVSSNIARMGYDEKAKELHLVFKKGMQEYKYSNVDEDTFLSLLMDPNPGKAIYAKIISKKTEHPFEKIEN